jgi:hypothetical protein
MHASTHWLGGAPDPPLAWLLVQTWVLWLSPMDCSSSWDFSWKQMDSSMLISPLIWKCLNFYAYEAETSFSASQAQQFALQLVTEAVFGI